MTLTESVTNRLGIGIGGNAGFSSNGRRLSFMEAPLLTATCVAVVW